MGGGGRGGNWNPAYILIMLIEKSWLFIVKAALALLITFYNCCYGSSH